MTTLVNNYFKKGVKSEVDLIQSLITEAIQVQGHTVYYLPRTLEKLDVIFGEDVLSKFEAALPIEMYIETFQNWEGEQELISKFGLEIRKYMTFSVSSKRWAQEVKKIANKMMVSSRPQEGDLIYDPLTNMVLEIKFVDQDDNLYQVGKHSDRFVYKLKCETFQFNNEEFSTGNPVIDDVPDLNILSAQLLGENNEKLVSEAGTEPLISEKGVSENSVFDSSEHLKEESKKLNIKINDPFNSRQ